MRLDTLVEALTFEDREIWRELSVEEALIRRLLRLRFSRAEILAALVEPEIFAQRTKS